MTTAKIRGFLGLHVFLYYTMIMDIVFDNPDAYYRIYSLSVPLDPYLVFNLSKHAGNIILTKYKVWLFK